MESFEKLGRMVLAVVLFAGVMGLILLLVGRVKRRSELVESLAFVVPALALLSVGLVYPAIRTTYQSFYDRTSDNFVGLDNYTEVFTNAAMLTVLQNTAIWVILTP